MHIQTLVDQFCEHAKYILGYSPDTIRRYRQTANLFRTHANVGEIRQVTDQTVRDFFLYGRVERGWELSKFLSINV